MRRFSLLALTIGAATLVAAEPAHAARDTTSVLLQNDRTVPVTVYLETGGREIQLGKVGPMATSTLVIPRWLVSYETPLHIFVHPANGDDQDSGLLEVNTGDRIGVIVPARDVFEPFPLDR
ncbi:MAG: hypothetical protein IT361_13745 [Gemmatimonadaceae bacterium]|nr:hypothetical protein [Gemmatimonadaceae bacterium]